MKDTIDIMIDVVDFPNTEDFYSTFRSFLKDKNKIMLFYNLLRKNNRNPKVKIDNIMEFVRFGLSFNSKGVKIKISFED